eukprot:m.76434 g.76434  ORF g.76434 m.76434 type:complete len:74 (-) comp14026_c0_seq1:1677-1898(-)
MPAAERVATKILLLLRLSDLPFPTRFSDQLSPSFFIANICHLLRFFSAYLTNYVIFSSASTLSFFPWSLHGDG